MAIVPSTVLQSIKGAREMSLVSRGDGKLGSVAARGKDLNPLFPVLNPFYLNHLEWFLFLALRLSITRLLEEGEHFLLCCCCSKAPSSHPAWSPDESPFSFFFFS